ncbi:MBL fold metallo-hydrolase [Cellulomonas edaphi]|uniref:MBL fold metallo-hydrolase n=1 Tax=Cellulomonas edaphi TaxID=3053468 RepID=A0ABT7S644_9CELL|nr:MBL fold metallo-hydrolase [Cellulomons edaphi]MDM7831083.1 MBL fold metallo-hydrolase [Cellulomons edaphi]
MSYTGDVRVGGGSDLRVLDHVEIRKLAVGPMENNAYLLTCRHDGAQLLVDAADEAEGLVELVREGSGAGRLDVVVTTHRHPDHTRALRSLVAVTGATVAVGAADADAVEASTDVPVGTRLRHGDVVTFGHVTLDVIELRGHTPGSIALAYTEPAHATGPEAVPGRVHLFTGDSLFPGGVGATRGNADHFAQLIDDVTSRVFAVFDDRTWVYPGHGLDTTLGAERPSLDEWRARGW